MLFVIGGAWLVGIRMGRQVENRVQLFPLPVKLSRVSPWVGIEVLPVSQLSRAVNHFPSSPPRSGMKNNDDSNGCSSSSSSPVSIAAGRREARRS